MLLKKLAIFHIIPIFIACLSCIIFFKHRVIQKPFSQINVNYIKQCNYIPNFQPYHLDNQITLSVALQKSIPVIFGSSELATSNLSGLASNFFNQQFSQNKLVAIGHAGFQCFAIHCVLAANKALLQNSKITIILSPGWFEKQYCTGTSLNSFFEFCPPNYMYQIYTDTTLDSNTRKHIQKYIYRNYEKITQPNSVMRMWNKNESNSIYKIANLPFNFINEINLNNKKNTDAYLTSQQLILKTIKQTNHQRYHFTKQTVNWDSLQNKAIEDFKPMSANNTMYVENDYYTQWVKGKPKKLLYAVNKKDNQEFKDFMALLQFFKSENIKPQFVIMPLNTLAHNDLTVLSETINNITSELTRNHFTYLDMFTPNVLNYQPSVLQDIMHPYNTGWYQIDKFILDNYHD